MIAFVAVLLSALAAALGQPLGPLSLNSAVRSQYHAQDELGQYSYGYSGGPSAKHEERTADGQVRGSFAYVDPNGRVQSRSYIADDLNGFRVVASDVPQINTIAAPVASWATPQGDPHWISRWSLDQSASVPSFQYAREVAVPAVPAVPLPHAVGNDALLGNGFGLVPSYEKQFYSPLGVIRSQHHAQDEAGQYTYGYSNELSSKSETKTADGVTRGSYSYVDPSGLVQTRSYVADAGGFRVTASDLPY